MNLVDSSGWIECFFGGESASYFSAPIEAIDRLIVPVIYLYEVFTKVNHVADEGRALQVVAQMKQGRVITITEEIALKTALVSLKHQLPMADSLVYATGQAEGTVVWAQDEDFQGLTGVRFKRKN